MDGIVVAFTLGLALLLGMVVGAVPALQLSGHERERRAAGRRTHRDGRPGCAVRAPGARRRAGGARLRAAHRGGPAAGQLPPASGRRSGFPGRARADRARLPAPVVVSRRGGASVVCEPRARAHPGAAGRGGRRRQQLPPVRVGQQQQRDHPRGLRHGARRVRRVAQPAVRHPRLSRGAARPAEAGTVTSPRATRLQRPASSSWTSGWPSGSGRFARSHRPPHVPAVDAGRRRQAGTRCRLAAGRRRGRHP